MITTFFGLIFNINFYIFQCTSQINFDDSVIQNCFESYRGVDLLKVIGESTNSLRPPITFQESILKDLLSEVCKAAGDFIEVRDICKI